MKGCLQEHIDPEAATMESVPSLDDGFPIAA